jgi:hypothetical protein
MKTQQSVVPAEARKEKGREKPNGFTKVLKQLATPFIV